MIEPPIFQTFLLRWFHQYGRKNLPWQTPRTPYRVWISEIMLQQTQVATVIPFFERFVTQFPSVVQLAQAEQDTVLHLWAGLGYYARARHLHHTAKIVTTEFAEVLPNDLHILQTLPGIGRSTAAAILSLGYNQPAAILDGNVKRVLCRLHAISEWPGTTAALKQLWQLAETYMSTAYPAHYTQAMMDFGSLICTRHQPKCMQCPFTAYCIAYQTAQMEQYPIPKPVKSRPTRYTRLLVLVNSQGQILMEKRPPTGIWGGLWSLPECDIDSILEVWCKQHNLHLKSNITYPKFLHSFSHFHLEIEPVLCYVQENSFCKRRFYEKMARPN